MPTQPPATISVDYAELEDGLSGGVDDKGDFESRTYLVAWADKNTFIQQLKGTSRQSGGPSGKWVMTVPYASPDNPNLYVNNITWVPWGTPIVPSNPTRYSHVKVTVSFRVPPFEFGPADTLNSLTQDSEENQLLQLCTQEIEYGRQAISIPNTTMKFLSDGRQISSALGRSISLQIMTLTYHRFPMLPVGYLRDYQDCINDATFLGCPRGTVLFENAHNQREAGVETAGGVATGNIGVHQMLKMVYKYRQYDWNMRARPDGPEFDYVVKSSYTTGGATTGSTYNNSVIYKYKDFRKLLWVDFLGTS
jgi:hypothetical protein